MSLWRSKRRYDANRRFSDRADEALYAIALLRRSDVIGLDQPDIDQIRNGLKHGEELLATLRDALKDPEAADEYAYTIAAELVSYYGEEGPKYVIERLDRFVSLLERAAESESYIDDLEEVTEALKVIEDRAAQTSERDAEQLRDHFVYSDR